MRARKLLPIAMKSLRVNKMRSFLTMLGIIIGVAAVIIMVAVGAGAQEKVDEQIASLGGNVLTIFPGFSRDAGVAGAAGSSASLEDRHANLIQEQVYGVVSAAPQISSSNTQLIYGNLNWQTRVEGVDNRFLEGANWEIAQGREFAPNEIASGGQVAMIGETIRKELFGESNPIGQTIRVNNFNVEIIATLKEKGTDTRGNDQDDTVFMPLRTVRSKLTGVQRGSPYQVRTILVKVASAEIMPYVQQEIAALLRQEMRVQPNQRDPFEIRDLAATMESRAETSRIFNQLLAAVASVSLVVGGIGIMNIMLVSVTERTREIGLRMAVGARPKDILNQFLVEAIVLCGLGGGIGVGLAWGTITLLEKFGEFSGVIHPEIVLGSIAFSALIGVFFGYYPAWKASKLQPIDALRYE